MINGCLVRTFRTANSYHLLYSVKQPEWNQNLGKITSRVWIGHLIILTYGDPLEHCPLGATKGSAEHLTLFLKECLLTF